MRPLKLKNIYCLPSQFCFNIHTSIFVLNMQRYTWSILALLMLPFWVSWEEESTRRSLLHLQMLANLSATCYHNSVTAHSSCCKEHARFTTLCVCAPESQNRREGRGWCTTGVIPKVCAAPQRHAWDSRGVTRGASFVWSYLPQEKWYKRADTHN